MAMWEFFSGTINQKFLEVSWISPVRMLYCLAEGTLGVFLENC